MTEQETLTVEPDEEAARTFTFESGTTVEIRRVNSLFIGKVSLAAEEKWKAENGEPACPTYSVKIAGGGEEVHDHNDVTIATEPWSEDEEVQAAWEKFQSDEQLLTAARIDATVRVCLKEGITSEPTPEWEEKRRYYGLEIPDHPKDKLFEFVHDASAGWVELIDCAWAIQTLPDGVEEVSRAAESIFPDSVGAPDGGTDTGASEGTTDGS